MIIKPEMLGYIAGVIDSDGYIGLCRQKESRRRGNVTENYKPVVVVTQAQPEAVNFIKEIFGGNTGITRQQDQKYRTLYRWGLYSNETVKNFLEIIEPYLRLKKKQARLVIEFCLTRIEAVQNKVVLRDSHGKFIKGSSRNTYTGVENQLWKQVLSLNQTGTGGNINVSSTH